MADPSTNDPSEELARLRALLVEKDALLGEKDALLGEKDAALVKEKRRSTRLAEKVKALELQLNLLKKQLFGKSSEKVDPRQLKLAFEEACGEADVPLLSAGPFPEELMEELANAEGIGPAEGKGRKRRRRRDKIPEDLEVQSEEIHPPAEDLRCDCGCDKVPMGVEERTRRLEVKPARFYWREYVRVKYVCPSCRTITRPPLPPAPIDKGLAGTSLLAEIIVSKYSDHLPLNRLERIYSRDGVVLSKSTLCSWTGTAIGLLEPIAEEVDRSVLSRPIVQTDETGILVLDPDHPEGRFKGRMWVYGGERGELSYEYTKTKEAKEPKRHLADFKGILQADAYPGFDDLFKTGDILEAGCNAHARRYFKDVHDAEPKRAEPQWALLAYHRLFAVEREAQDLGLDAEGRLALRQEKSAPIVTEFYNWLEQLQPKLTPTDPLRRAVNYALNHREALTRFLCDGRIEIHNNRSELVLRQVAVGRSSWLFAGSPAGAEWAAIAYTLIMSCRELGISERDYLVDVLDRVSIHPADRVHELTPRGWKAAREAATAAGAPAGATAETPA
jgi:transposase